MPSILSRLRGADSRQRDAISSHFLFNGYPHSLWPGEPAQSMPGSPQELPPTNFQQMVRTAHRRNGVVAGAVTARALLVSQMRFVWRSEIDGSTFGNASLAPLERPAPGLTRSQLLWRLEQDVCYAGNAYVLRTGDGSLRRLRPDWVRIVLGSDSAPDDVSTAWDAHPVGYLYGPDPERSRPRMFGLSEVAHIAPEPDPMAHYRGESWVSSVVREILIDLQATDHLGSYFENAATGNMVIKAPDNVETRDQFMDWVDATDASLSGPVNAWRNLYLGAGADVQVVGSSLADLDLKNLQGGLESRIALRSRVPAAVLGIREGMDGSALNAGNYTATRRLWADGWFSPYAQSVCSSLERIIARPSASELTFDPGRILFLQEDAKDAAEIMATHATALQALDSAGYMADAAVTAIKDGNLGALIGGHDGLQSVQRQPTDAGAQMGASV